MKRLPEQEVEIDPIAKRVYEDVVCSMEQYTNDSMFSKFYLPEPLVSHSRTTASIFTQIHYAPLLTHDEAVRTRLFGLLLLSIICGAQIYLKERSIFTNFAPYRVRSDKETIKDIKHRVTKMLFDGATILETTDQVMHLFLAHMVTPRTMRRLAVSDHDFDSEKFDRFMPASILWGYLFAKEMILD